MLARNHQFSVSTQDEGKLPLSKMTLVVPIRASFPNAAVNFCRKAVGHTPAYTFWTQVALCSLSGCSFLVVEPGRVLITALNANQF